GAPAGRAVGAGEVLERPDEHVRLCLLAPERARDAQAEHPGTRQGTDQLERQAAIELDAFGLGANRRAERAHGFPPRRVRSQPVGSPRSFTSPRAWRPASRTGSRGVRGGARPATFGRSRLAGTRRSSLDGPITQVA